MFETANDTMPVITEFPLQTEPSAELGVPEDTVPPELKSREGNVLVKTKFLGFEGHDVEGFQIMVATEYFNGMAQCEAYFAANPAVGLYCTFDIYLLDMDDLRPGIKVQPITPAEEATLRQFFPTGEFGTPVLPWESVPHNEA